MRLSPSYDAIVVGSGLGGSTLALRLAQYGRKVLVVDRGSVLRPRPRAASDPVGVHFKQSWSVGSTTEWPVGGQTKFYGAALYRMRESDFRAVEHEAGTSPSWPIAYRDLEPYYQQAEELYRVHGSPDGDPSEPPRSRPFPHQPIPHDPLVARIVDRLVASGTSVSAIPRGIDHGPGGKCVLCATCDAYYCQLDAKMDAEIAALRPALASGGVELASETECLRVLTDDSGTRATGVELRRDGEDHVVHADIVAVGSGTQDSIVLLRRSGTPRHPNGLGNQGGSLGRYLAGHSVGMIFPLISWRTIPPIHCKSFALNGFHDGASDFPWPAGVIQSAGQMPFWDEASRWMRPAARLVGAHSLMCFYMTEALPTRDSGLIFDGDRIVGRVAPIANAAAFDRLRRAARDAFRRAGYVSVARRQEPVLWHQVGTARMGEDPSNSVVDPRCQVHGISGLYVVDGSVLPTAGAVNTGLTIVALSLRTGDVIAGRDIASAGTMTAGSASAGSRETRPPLSVAG